MDEKAEMTLKERRIAHIQVEIPGLLKHKTILYIGAKIKKRWGKGNEMLPLFVDAGYKIDIVEVFEQNYNALQHFNQNGRNFLGGRVEAGAFRNIIHGNVLDLDILEGLDPEGYDVTMFWHEPEHLDLPDLRPTIQRLEERAKHLSILGCPFGVYHQAAVNGNEWEIHRSALYPIYFERLGYTVATLGRRDEKKSHITAWKRKEQ